MLVQTKFMFFTYCFSLLFLYWNVIEFYQFLCKVWHSIVCCWTKLELYYSVLYCPSCYTLTLIFCLILTSLYYMWALTFHCTLECQFQSWILSFRPILSNLLYISSDILSHFNQPTLRVSFDIPLYIGMLIPMSIPIWNFTIPSCIVQTIIH